MRHCAFGVGLDEIKSCELEGERAGRQADGEWRRRNKRQVEMCVRECERERMRAGQSLA